MALIKKKTFFEIFPSNAFDRFRDEQQTYQITFSPPKYTFREIGIASVSQQMEHRALFLLILKASFVCIVYG